MDLHLGKIGKVKEVNDQTLQPIIIADNGKRKIMIPLVDDFLIDLDRIQKDYNF